jgi:hypothetical protein
VLVLELELMWIELEVRKHRTSAGGRLEASRVLSHVSYHFHSPNASLLSSKT